MRQWMMMAVAAAGLLPAGAGAQASVQVEASHVQGRQLEEQTAKAVVKDYVESWETLHSALHDNRVDGLDRDFVGDARDRIAKAIEAQAKAGIRSNYQDRSHQIQVIFYSPEGLSIELTDDVEYDQQLLDKDKVLTTQHMTARYVVVLTPSETRWRVRVFEAVAGENRASNSSGL